MIDTVAVKNRILELAIRGNLVKCCETNNLDMDVVLSDIETERNNLLKHKATKICNKVDMLQCEIFEIPNNWKWVALGDLCIMLSRGKSPKYVEKSKIPVFAQKCNQPTKLALDKAQFLDETTLEKWPEYFRLREKDIVINSTGTGTMGRVGYYTNDTLNPVYKFMLPDSHVTVVRVGENIVSKYLYYALRTPTLQSIMEKSFRGSTNQKEFYIDSVYAMPIPLPPINEQKLIVNKLDDVFSTISEIDIAQEAYTKNSEILKNKLINAGIQGKLTKQLPEDGTAEELYYEIQNKKDKLIKEGKIKKEKVLPEVTEDEIPFDIPKNWKWVRLGNICSKITSGSTPTGGKKSNVYVEEGYSFFREQNIYNDGIHEEGLVYITEELLNTRTNSTVFPRDILLNITGGSIGRCAIIPDDFTKGSINQHILIIRLTDTRLRYYIHYYLCSSYVQKYIKGNAVGDKDGFSGGRCKNLLIPLPPISEQERIVKKLDELLAVM